MERKGPFTVKELKSLSPGTQLWGKYLVVDKVQRKTKDGREVIHLKVGDQSGDIDTIVWDNCVVNGVIETGLVIGLLGDMGTYNNRLQITAKRIKILQEDVTDYLKKPDIGIDNLIEQFEATLEEIKDPYMKNLLNRIFNPDMRARFYKATAAKKIHHNYVGGLLEHTMSVVRLCRQAALNYPIVNKDLLLTGAILHDLGKIEEYSVKVVPEYTMTGKMMGHIVLGVEKVGSEIKIIRSEEGFFPEELELMIKHMILSHHGSLEFGSPVIPLFPEAFLLHMMDNLDAKMFIFCNKIEDDDSGDPLFTNYDSFFGQQFFKYRYPGQE